MGASPTVTVVPPVARKALPMDSDNGRARGGSIRSARRALELSQEELARLAQCSTVYVRMLESGFTPSQSSVIPRILAVLNEKRPGGNQVALRTSAAGQGRHGSE